MTDKYKNVTATLTLSGPLADILAIFAAAPAAAVAVVPQKSEVEKLDKMPLDDETYHVFEKIGELMARAGFQTEYIHRKFIYDWMGKHAWQAIAAYLGNISADDLHDQFAIFFETPYETKLTKAVAEFEKAKARAQAAQAAQDEAAAPEAAQVEAPEAAQIFHNSGENVNLNLPLAPAPVQVEIEAQAAPASQTAEVLRANIIELAAAMRKKYKIADRDILIHYAQQVGRSISKVADLKPHELLAVYESLETWDASLQGIEGGA